MNAHMIISIYYANFRSLLWYGIIFWLGIMKVLKYLNCKKGFCDQWVVLIIIHPVERYLKITGHSQVPVYTYLWNNML
jgi:hypothetical protein